jgi:hypothetical protein
MNGRATVRTRRLTGQHVGRDRLGFVQLALALWAGRRLGIHLGPQSGQVSTNFSPHVGHCRSSADNAAPQFGQRSPPQLGQVVRSASICAAQCGHGVVAESVAPQLRQIASWGLTSFSHSGHKSCQVAPQLGQAVSSGPRAAPHIQDTNPGRNRQASLPTGREREQVGRENGFVSQTW